MSNSKECSHSTNYWTSRQIYNDWTGEYDTEDVHESEWTMVDIDTHRYKCTQCNKVMYYSGRAQQVYEAGGSADDVW